MTDAGWRHLVVAAALGVALVPAVTGAHVAQADRPIVFSRVCNVVPDGRAEAERLAGEMAALVNGRYPGAELTAQTGRWMTGFQSLAVPVDQIRFTEQHADETSREDFAMILLGDEEFVALQRQVAAFVDFGTCTETQFRAPS